MKLIICGNGLDIHVGLDTSYKAYRRYLENEKVFDGKKAISIIENSCFFVPRNTDCWSDLENALSFDCEKYIRGYLDAFDRDTDINRYGTCISQIKAAGEFLKQSPKEIARDFTNSWFWEWIARQYYLNIEEICETRKKDILFNIIDKDSVCINFNYTHTLEDLLGLREEQILYIHNRLPNKRNTLFDQFDFERDILSPSRKQFQFGSVKNNLDEWNKLIASVQISSSGKLINIKELRDELIQIYMAFSKDLSNNYSTLEEFIKGYEKEISEIYVLGHSILGVDEPYYADVIVPLLCKKKWNLYYHGDSNEVNQFVEKYDLSNYAIFEW